MAEVTIAIPTHNRARLLARALRTCSGQSQHDIEIIVYDDCSQEDILEIVHEADDIRITYVRGSPRKLECGSRNVIIDLVKTPYLCWLDSDDMCNFRRVEYQLKVMKKLNPSYLRCHAQHLWDEAAVNAVRWDKKSGFVTKPRMATPTTMVLAERAREIRYHEDILFGCDVLFELEMTEKYGQGLLLPLGLYYRDMTVTDRVSKTYGEQEAHDKVLHEKLERQREMRNVLLKSLKRQGTERAPRVLGKAEVRKLLGAKSV